MDYLLLALALLPSSAIAVWLYRKDLHEKEEKRHLWWAFVLGIFSVFVALILDAILGEPFDKAVWFKAFIAAGLVEEVSKFLMFRAFIYNKSYFNEPYDGIIYCALVSLGFATFENLLYVFGEGGGYGVAIMRLLMAVPGHAIMGVIQGYYAGQAKFKQSSGLLFLGLALAAVFHGCYDYFLFQKTYPLLGLISVGLIYYGVKLSKKAVKIHQDSSPFIS